MLFELLFVIKNKQICYKIRLLQKPKATFADPTGNEKTNLILRQKKPLSVTSRPAGVCVKRASFTKM